MVMWLLLLLVACEDDPCPRGDMLESEGGMLVTDLEHPTGWGQADCEGCHFLPQLHQLGCSDVDLEAVREQANLDDCSSCHGDNGVTP